MAAAGYFGTGTSTSSEKTTPVAVLSATPEFAVVGSIVQLDGSRSEGDTLSYSWEFLAVPVGSMVSQEGFKNVATGSSDIVSFSPDIVGTYIVGLTVSNGDTSSSQATLSISVRSMLVPHGRGVVPNASWIWSYLRDIWKDVENKEWFEVLWSSLVQITGGELLKAYQVDFNKSIRDIQDQFQRRWLSYEPKLLLDKEDVTYYLGKTAAGGDAASTDTLQTGLCILTSNDEIIIVRGIVSTELIGRSIEVLEGPNLGTYTIAGLSPNRLGYRLLADTTLPSPSAELISASSTVYFDFQSTTWTFDVSLGPDYALSMSVSPSPMSWLYIRRMGIPAFPALSPGHVIYIRGGANAGLYIVTSVSGTSFTVDRAPPSSSTSGSPVECSIYSGISIEFPQSTETTCASFGVAREEMGGIIRKVDALAPGRVVTIGSLGFTVLKSFVDTNQNFPLIFFTSNSDRIPTGLYGQYWRVPNTLLSSSLNFEELGVRAGDRLVLEAIKKGSTKRADVECQVVGVSDFGLGFTFDSEEVVPGEATDETSFVKELLYKFNVPTVTLNAGEYVLSGEAEEIYSQVRQLSLLWNTSISYQTLITIGSLEFYLRPKYIIRNSLVPVDDDIISVPVLQEFIRQPSIVQRDGITYQIKDGTEYQLQNAPSVLLENEDFTISNEVAFSGTLTFKTGSVFVDADDGDFIDRDIRQGDTFSIESPITLIGDYLIAGVVGRNKLQLTTAVPLHTVDKYVTARVKITRRVPGNFIRFIPGKFSPTSCAPSRLWAEVSFFDNSQSIEDNFGILVGLTKDDVEGLTSSLNYRKAVTGLMYAYSNGSSVEKIRLGAQILLGLPYAEHRGIIRSIDKNYRLDVNGVPITGRILVEDVTESDEPTGTLRVYTYPIDLESDSLAGVETSPVTEEEYVVGDTVELFAPLCKGVLVTDYVSNALGSEESATKFLQQYHSSIVQVNDRVFSSDEIELVSDFLGKVTPAYVASIIRARSDLTDSVVVEDALELALVTASNDLVCVATQADVTPTAYTPVQLGAVAGDFVQITTGANSTVDVGYGAGLYPVESVGATTITLSSQLGTSGTFQWKLVRRS